VTVEGLAVAQTSRVLQIGENAPAGRASRRLAESRLRCVRARQRTAVARWVVQQTGMVPTTVCCATGRACTPGVDKHRGYALQWFALAALITALTVYFGLRALRRRSPSTGCDD
jgi:surfeit locus 1 family protein